MTHKWWFVGGNFDGTLSWWIKDFYFLIVVNLGWSHLHIDLIILLRIQNQWEFLQVTVLSNQNSSFTVWTTGIIRILTRFTLRSSEIIWGYFLNTTTYLLGLIVLLHSESIKIPVYHFRYKLHCNIPISHIWVGLLAICLTFCDALSGRLGLKLFLLRLSKVDFGGKSEMVL